MSAMEASVTTKSDSATPAPEVSPEDSDSLLQDVDFGVDDVASPPSGEKDGSQAGQDGAGDVAKTGDEETPKTYTQAELDTRIEEAQKVTQSARDSEFDTLSNRMKTLEQSGQSSEIDLATNAAIGDVTEQIKRAQPELSHNEAQTQARGGVMAFRRQWDAEQALSGRSSELDQRQESLASESRNLASQTLRNTYGLTDEQIEKSLKMPDSDSMKEVAVLYQERNAAAAINDKNNQNSRPAQDFVAGSVAGDIVPGIDAVDDAEMAELMNLGTRDGTLSDKMTDEMIADGWTP